MNKTATLPNCPHLTINQISSFVAYSQGNPGLIARSISSPPSLQLHTNSLSFLPSSNKTSSTGFSLHRCCLIWWVFPTFCLPVHIGTSTDLLSWLFRLTGSHPDSAHCPHWAERAKGRDKVSCCKLDCNLWAAQPNLGPSRIQMILRWSAELE